MKRHPLDRTELYSYSFTPTSRGRYTAYCFLNTGRLPSASNVAEDSDLGQARSTDEDIDLDEFERVFALAAAALMNTSTAQGLAHHTWTEVFRTLKLFSQLESITAVTFCVGDPEEDCKFYSTPSGGVSGAPDLEVESLTVSKSAVGPEETFTLTASVLNAGSGASSETTLRYYRSTTSTFSTSVTEDPVIVVIGLDPSGTERVSHPLAVPSDPGLYYYRTCVAPASGESNTDNNCSTGVRVTVDAAQQGSPDLVVEAPSVSRNEIQPGGRFTLGATVRNIGDARAGSAILRYYRSPNSSISADSDTEVGSDTVNSLQPSRTDGESVGVSAPEAPGEYYYGACVVPVTGESDIGNNCSSGRRVTVAQAATNPDLVVDSPSVSQNEVDAGGRFTLRTTVRNRGDGPAPRATLRYYRSADSTISTGDAEVETDRVRYLDPSETGDEWERLTAPDDAGTYYYGACVDSVTDESNTANNCSSGVRVTVTEALQDSPDLVVSVSVVSVSIGDTELEPGETFAVTSWVSNSGLATSPATTLRIYRSTDSSISAGDTVIGEVNVRSLAPSETQGYDLRNQIAPSVAGTYYYGSCVESVSGESDTTNNCSSGVQVTVTAAPQITRAALRALYNATDGANWTRNTNWLSDAPIGQWYGVRTDSGGLVTRLDLSYNRLTGEIPAELGNLSNLVDLRLHANQLTGEIPEELGNLSNLEHLYLHANQLTGEIPAELGSLSNLVDLYLNINQLTGEIPAELGNLSNLTVLWLSNNRLTGEIPAELGNLSNLTASVPRHGNQLTGEIPAELGSLSNLVDLYLNINQLTGEIPAELGNLSNLTVLWLSNNRLTGEIPEELGNLSNLVHLRLYNNQLTGEIPAELGSLSSLERLHLGSNQLTGEIPAELGSLSNLNHLYLHGNQLTGEIPAEFGFNQLTTSPTWSGCTLPAELGNLSNLTSTGRGAYPKP